MFGEGNPRISDLKAVGLSRNGLAVLLLRFTPGVSFLETVMSTWFRLEKVLLSRDTGNSARLRKA